MADASFSITMGKEQLVGVTARLTAPPDVLARVLAAQGKKRIAALINASAWNLRLIAESPIPAEVVRRELLSSGLEGLGAQDGLRTDGIKKLDRLEVWRTGAAKVMMRFDKKVLEVLGGLDVARTFFELGRTGVILGQESSGVVD